MGAYIEEKNQTIAEVAIGGQALEDTIQQLRALYAEVEAYQPTFDEAEAMHQVEMVFTHTHAHTHTSGMYITSLMHPSGVLQSVQAAMVFDNPHTPYTMEVGAVHACSAVSCVHYYYLCVCCLADPSRQLVTAVGINQEEHQ